MIPSYANTVMAGSSPNVIRLAFGEQMGEGMPFAPHTVVVVEKTLVPEIIRVLTELTTVKH
jgi:hypothetical protein